MIDEELVPYSIKTDQVQDLKFWTYTTTAATEIDSKERRILVRKDTIEGKI